MSATKIGGPSPSSQTEKGTGENLVVVNRAAAFQPRIWTRDSILFAAHRWTEWAGRTPRWVDWEAGRVAGEPYRPASRTVMAHFGSWLAMIDAAGLMPAPEGAPRVWSRERILVAMRLDAERRGRWPLSTEWDAATAEHPHKSQVIRRFGSWTLAQRQAGRVGPPTWKERRMAAREKAREKQRAYRARVAA